MSKLEDSEYQKKVAKVCAKIGQLLVTGGAEIPSVEETVEFIGGSANVEISCYVTLNAVFINIADETNSQFVKTPYGSLNLQKVDDINRLSQKFNDGKISFDDLSKQIDEIATSVIEFPLPLKLLGAGLVSVPPMMIFMATWKDLVLSFFIGMLGYVISHHVETRTNTPYIKEALSAFCISVISLLLTDYHLGSNSNNIILSSIMPLVPGIAITNSIRELIARHTISGMIRAVDALFTAGAIGAGVLIADRLIQIVLNILGG